MQFSLVLFMTALITSFFSAVSPQSVLAGELTWLTSKQEAFTLAERQGKKVLLVAGRDT